jgi:hypothetical protein
MEARRDQRPRRGTAPRDLSVRKQDAQATGRLPSTRSGLFEASAPGPCSSGSFREAGCSTREAGGRKVAEEGRYAARRWAAPDLTRGRSAPVARRRIRRRTAPRPRRRTQASRRRSRPLAISPTLLPPEAVGKPLSSSRCEGTANCITFMERNRSAVVERRQPGFRRHRVGCSDPCGLDWPFYQRMGSAEA